MRLQWFVLLLGIAFFAFVIEFVRRRRLTESFVLIWAGVGLGGVVLAIARPLVDAFSRWIGVETGTSVIFALAILFMMIFSLYLSMHVTKAEDRIERLAEEVALLRGVEQPDEPGSHADDNDSRDSFD